MTVDALPAALNVIAVFYLGLQGMRAWEGSKRNGGALSLASWSCGIAATVLMTLTVAHVIGAGA